jgi:hypothetical protein
MHSKVNGPYNIAHLKSPDNQKSIYIFFDIHASRDRETSCDTKYNTQNVYIADFFKGIFEKTKKKIDFLIEIYPSHIIHKDVVLDDDDMIYLEQVRLLVRNEFNIDSEKTTVIQSEKYPNVRLHYVDIRDPFMELVNLDMVTRWISDEQYLHEYTTRYDWRSLKRYVNSIANTIKMVQKIMSTGTKNAKKVNVMKIYFEHFNKLNSIKKKEHETILKYIMTKVTTRIKNPTLSKVIDFMINDQMRNAYETIQDTADIMDRCNNSNDFFSYAYQFYNNIVDYSVFLMDMYTIRRIVDKDYMNTVFLYVGGEHASNYILILMNILKYDLVSIDKHTERSLNELKKKISETMDYKEVHQYISNDTLQCSTVPTELYTELKITDQP